MLLSYVVTDIVFPSLPLALSLSHTHTHIFLSLCFVSHLSSRALKEVDQAHGMRVSRDIRVVPPDVTFWLLLYC
jgi:hypothetical protein